MKNGTPSSAPIKLGPLWDRTLFDLERRQVRRRFRTVCHFDEIEALRVREYINRDEEEQLLNLHPEVQKAPRDAELWIEMKDGRSLCVASLDRAGLLLQQAAEIGQQINVPVQTERRLIAPSEPTGGPRAT
jgi:hypothetical protein